MQTQMRTNDTRRSGWARTTTHIVAGALLAALAANGRTQALAAAEAVLWTLVLASLALKLSGWSRAGLDARLAGLLPTALGLSATSALSKILGHDPQQSLVALQHLPVTSSDGAIWSTVRALAVGLMALVLSSTHPSGRRRSTRLVLIGAAATLTAADLGGLDLVTAPMAGLVWLLAGMACIVAREWTLASSALASQWRRMLAFAVLMLAGVELVAIGLRPSMAAMAFLTVRYGPWLALLAGRRPLVRRLALGWSALMLLDLVHRSVFGGGEWTLAALGAIVAAALVSESLMRASGRVGHAPMEA